MENPAYGKSETAIKVIQKIHRDSKDRKFYSSFWEEECVQLSIDKEKSKEQDEEDYKNNPVYNAKET